MKKKYHHNINIKIALNRSHAQWAVWYILSHDLIPFKLLKKRHVLDFIKKQFTIHGLSVAVIEDDGYWRDVAVYWVSKHFKKWEFKSHDK